MKKSFKITKKWLACLLAALVVCGTVPLSVLVTQAVTNTPQTGADGKVVSSTDPTTHIWDPTKDSNESFKLSIDNYDDATKIATFRVQFRLPSTVTEYATGVAIPSNGLSVQNARVGIGFNTDSLLPVTTDGTEVYIGSKYTPGATNNYQNLIKTASPGGIDLPTLDPTSFSEDYRNAHYVRSADIASIVVSGSGANGGHSATLAVGNYQGSGATAPLTGPQLGVVASGNTALLAFHMQRSNNYTNVRTVDNWDISANVWNDYKISFKLQDGKTIEDITENDIWFGGSNANTANTDYALVGIYSSLTTMNSDPSILKNPTNINFLQTGFYDRASRKGGTYSAVYQDVKPGDNLNTGYYKDATNLATPVVHLSNLTFYNKDGTVDSPLGQVRYSYGGSVADGITAAGVDDKKQWMKANADGAYIDANGNVTTDPAQMVPMNAQTIGVGDHYVRLYEGVVNPITITFDKNGANATGTTGTDNNQEVTTETATLAANGFTNPGLTFLGWNTKADGSGTSYNDQDQIARTVGDITLYAQWGYPVTFHLGEGATDWTNDPIGKYFVSANGKVFEKDATANTYTEKADPVFPVSGTDFMPATGYQVKNDTWNYTNYDANGPVATKAEATGYTTVNLTELITNADAYATANGEDLATIRQGLFTFTPVWQVEVKTYTVTAYDAANKTFTYDAGTSQWMDIDSSIDTAPMATRPAGTESQLQETATWYTEANAAGNAVTFPYTVTAPVNLYPYFAEVGKTNVVFNADPNNLGNVVWTDPADSTNLSIAAPYTLPTQTPSRTGYIFKGWTTNANGQDENPLMAGSQINTDDNRVFVEGEDYNLYAVWEAKPVIVKLTDGTNTIPTTGSFVSDLTYEDNLAGLPTTLPNGLSVDTGKYFTGKWLSGNTEITNGTAISTIVGTETDTDYTITLTADLADITYTYEFDLGNGTGTAPTLADQTYTEATTNPHTIPDDAGLIAPKGYYFNGWKVGTDATPTDATTITIELLEKATDVQGQVGQKKLTFTADWQPTTLIIKFESGDPTATGTVPATITKNYEEIKALTGADANIPGQGDLAVTNKYWDGWTIGGDKVTETTLLELIDRYLPTDDNTVMEVELTIVGSWVNAFTLTFNGNGGTPAEQIISVQPGTQPTSQPTDPTREGYTFSGWNTDANGNGDTYNAGAVPTGSTTYYAQWTPLTYTVTFNGGDGATGTMADQTFTHGVAQNLTTNAFAKEGHTFNGWLGSDGNTYTDAQSVTLTSGLTLTAQWTANPVTVYLNNGELNGQNIQFATSAYGQSFTLPTQDALPVGFAPANSILLGWKYNKVTAAGTIEEQVAAGTSIPLNDVANANLDAGISVLFTAVWDTIQADEVGIIFNANTTDVVGGSLPTNISHHLLTNDLVLDGSQPTRAGYTFAGWSTNPNAQVGTDTIYAANDTISATEFTGLGGTTYTLHAIWTPKTYTVQFIVPDANGSYTVDITLTSTQLFNEAITVPGTPTVPANKEFKGWFTGPNGTGVQLTDQLYSALVADDTVTTLSIYAYFTDVVIPPVDPVVPTGDITVTLSIANNTFRETYPQGATVADVIVKNIPEGQRFLGWLDENGNLLSSDTPLVDGMVLTAWLENNVDNAVLPSYNDNYYYNDASNVKTGDDNTVLMVASIGMGIATLLAGAGTILFVKKRKND